jgi:hypothetical protein
MDQIIPWLRHVAGNTAVGSIGNFAAPCVWVHWGVHDCTLVIRKLSKHIVSLSILTLQSVIVIYVPCV